MDIDHTQRERLDSLYHSVVEYLHRNDRVRIGSKLLDNATAIELSILKLAEERPGLIVKDISLELGAFPSTLTSALDRLEGRGLIERGISQRDRRSFTVTLTKLGKRAQNDHRKGEREFFDRMLSFLDDPDERGVFLDAVEKVLAGFLAEESGTGDRPKTGKPARARASRTANRPEDRTGK